MAVQGQGSQAQLDSSRPARQMALFVDCDQQSARDFEFVRELCCSMGRVLIAKAYGNAAVHTRAHAYATAALAAVSLSAYLTRTLLISTCSGLHLLTV